SAGSSPALPPLLCALRASVVWRVPAGRDFSGHLAVGLAAQCILSGDGYLHRAMLALGARLWQCRAVGCFHWLCGRAGAGTVGIYAAPAAHPARPGVSEAPG